MEDKIEVGEYVRTDTGIILEFQKIDEDGYMWGSNYKGCYKEDIVKHSKNIIDLIEVGDYINGERVFEIEKNKFVKGQIDIFVNRDEVNYWGDRSLSLIINKDIKSVVTKEQFKQIEYKVEG